MFDFKNESSEAPDLEMLSDSFLEHLESVRQMMDEFSADFSVGKDESIEEMDDEESDEDDEDDENDESEYAEVYGASKEELKKYTEKFKEYARSIKRGLEEIYGIGAENAENREKKRDEKTENDFGIKSPDERGHKMGCGCPGCAAYREFYGIKLENKTHSAGHAFSGFRMNESGKNAEKYEEKANRPCGGKLYGHFHGERADLKNVFGQYTGRFNFGRAGY